MTFLEDKPVFIIAEAGVNHNGDMDTARRLIEIAARSGADAVKFQSFRAESLVSSNAPKAAYQVRTTGADDGQYAMLKKLELTLEDHHSLILHCEACGIQFLSTPFDEKSADLLETLGVEIIKLPSGEVINTPFLSHVAAKGLPVILSTGMANLKEVGAAVQTLRYKGTNDLVLLQCVTDYPADPADTNLKAMSTMAKAFAVPVGYSDHTLGNEVAFGAVALGAKVIEKHFTLDRGMPGPDHAASAEPNELEALVKGIRVIESALGSGLKEPVARELETRAIVRKSLHTAIEIPAGSLIQRHMVTILRPACGLPPKDLENVIGARAAKTIPIGTAITTDMIL